MLNLIIHTYYHNTDEFSRLPTQLSDKSKLTLIMHQELELVVLQVGNSKLISEKLVDLIREE